MTLDMVPRPLAKFFGRTADKHSGNPPQIVGGRRNRMRQRGQSGFTLMEVMIALTIGSAVLLPLLGLTMVSLGIKAQSLLINEETGTVGTANAYFITDVANAKAVATTIASDASGGDVVLQPGALKDCLGGTAESQGGDRSGSGRQVVLHRRAAG